MDRQTTATLIVRRHLLWMCGRVGKQRCIHVHFRCCVSALYLWNLQALCHAHMPFGLQGRLCIQSLLHNV